MRSGERILCLAFVMALLVTCIAALYVSHNPTFPILADPDDQP